VIRRLLLWDIDGTLVRTGGIGSGAFDLALADVLGEVPPGRVVMSGKTDRLIVHEQLALLGREPDPAVVDAVLVRLVDRLADVAHRIPEQGSACPGALRVLESLAGLPDVASGCLTGNLRPNALVKLAAFGLDRFIDLDVGAYGSDHFDRNSLLPLALDRAAARFGTAVAPEDTWVIGDTPLDLACARAGNARCLLVATGTYPLDELEALAPDAALPDLTDSDAVVALLAGAPEAVQT
jgi:phosphoglycolate phosphatase